MGQWDSVAGQSTVTSHREGQARPLWRKDFVCNLNAKEPARQRRGGVVAEGRRLENLGTEVTVSKKEAMFGTQDKKLRELLAERELLQSPWTKKTADLVQGLGSILFKD